MSHSLDEHDDYDDERTGGHVEPHRGVLILVLGILGLMVCGIIGIFAWIMGKRDLDLMRRGLMDREGEALTKVGYILGIVATVLVCFWLLIFVLYIVFVVIMVAAK
jgi:hypothetical protein